MPGIIAPFPAIKSLGGYIEVTVGKSGIVVVGIVVIKPFKSLLGFL